jgi:hypothetical protein
LFFSDFVERNIFLFARFAMALALGNGLEPKINETTKDSSNVIVRITSDVVKQVTFYFIKSFDFIGFIPYLICS